MTLRTFLEDTLAHASTPATLLVVTDSHVGSTLATDLAGTVDVTLLTDREGVAARVPDCIRTVIGGLTDGELLATVGSATVAVVALRRDRRALLVTQLLRTRFDTDALVVLLNDPMRRELFDDIATTVVCGSTHLSAALGDAVAQTLPEPTESHS